jgi:hypothetical protein
MLEDVALMEMRDVDLAVASEQLDTARKCYRNRDDVLRVTIEEADALAKQNNPKRALDLLRDALTNEAGAPAAPLLRKKEQDISASQVKPTTP